MPNGSAPPALAKLSKLMSTRLLSAKGRVQSVPVRTAYEPCLSANQDAPTCTVLVRRVEWHGQSQSGPRQQSGGAHANDNCRSARLRICQIGLLVDNAVIP